MTATPPQCTVTFPGQHEPVAGGSGPRSVGGGRTRSGVPALPGPGYHRQHGHQPHFPARPRLQLSTTAQTVPDTSRQVAPFIYQLKMYASCFNIIYYNSSMYIWFSSFSLYCHFTLPTTTAYESNSTLFCVVGLLSSSIDMEIKVWCSEGWYGEACDRKCSTDDSFRACAADGTITKTTKCLDDGIHFELAVNYIMIFVFKTRHGQS